MKKAIAILSILALLCGLMAGCGTAPAAAPETKAPETTAPTTAAPETTAATEPTLSDQELADAVAELIDAIYVQKRTDDTDAQCAAAKAAWDALTDEQKELVEGEEADPDYFGRDTGDASLDNTRNQDDIGEKEILVVSFGTSFNDSRYQDICKLEDAIADAFPDWSVRRAFTAQIIINHVQARDEMFIDNMDQAMERAVANGVKTLVIQPTHLMHGAEYDELMESVEQYRDKIDTIEVAEPLLGEVGADATVINADKEIVAKAVVAAACADAGYADADALAEDSTAIVLLGHGTSHTAKVSYSQMNTQMEKLGYKNVFVGTVEGEPEETSVENIIEAVSEAGYENVILRPLMLVAGDHANNDMAGDDDDSWKSLFLASGDFKKVDCQIAGLGRIPEIMDLYIAHTQAVIGEPTTLADGTYTAKFDTDSGMFHVNEANEGRGVLTVKDGKMTIHVSLGGKGFLNMFMGSAEDAQKEGAEILQHTEDTVTYKDGTSETVYGFDIPVKALDKEISVALIGKKGVWYDHTFVVSDPQPVE